MSECPTPAKQVHRSKAAALKARESLEVADGIDLGLRPYRCCCGAWHLGHPHKNDRVRQERVALASGRRATQATRRRRKR